jgi:hypothetical protein
MDSCSDRKRLELSAARTNLKPLGNDAACQRRELLQGDLQRRDVLDSPPVCRGESNTSSQTQFTSL